MYYLLDNNGQYSIFLKKEYVPEFLRDKVIEVDRLPEGNGVLKRADDGSFYFDAPPTLEQPTSPEPEVPVENQESVEEKLARMEQQLANQEAQTLMIVDINLTLYEEVLNLRDQLASKDV